MIWFVALGSAVGGIARYLLSVFIQDRAGPGFPVGTLVVNASGSFLLGTLVRGLGASAFTPEIRAMLTIGLCGGYTTFSTFSYETAIMVERGDYLRAATYIALSLILSLIAMWVGFLLARALLAARGPAA